MYYSSRTLIGNGKELANYVKDYDVYNSIFLKRLASEDLPREYYKIETFEYRPDLIAKDFYGSSDYSALVIIQNAMPLSSYSRGTILRLIPKDYLDNLLVGS